MHLIELILSLACIGFYTSFFAPNFLKLQNTILETSKLKKEMAQDFFVVSGVKNICLKYEKTDIDKKIINFKQMCCSMWDFQEFLIYSENTKNGTLYKVFWRTNSKAHSIVCHIES